MFNKVALLAFVAPLVAGLTVQIPENPTSGGTITVKWTTAPGDPATFTLELTNESFHNAFAIANNVQPESGQLTLTLPIVPVGDGYTIEAVDIGNIGNVFASTGSFSVGPNSASTSTTSTSGTSTSTGTSSGTKSTTSVTTPLPTTTSGFGTTVANTQTTSSSSGTSSGTTSSSPATTSNAAMAPLKMNSNIGAVAAVLFSAIAGAAIVAF